MGRPPKIKMAVDEKKTFSQPGVIEALRAISEKQEWSLGFVVWAASEAVKPKAPADVSAADLEAATPEIISRGKREKGDKENGKVASNKDGRLPLNDEVQKLWDAGTWKGKLSVHGLRERFKAEIKDGVDLTLSMLDAYAAELATEKAKIFELLDEQPDPDSGPVSCESPVHRGDEKSFQPAVAHKLFRNSTGALERQKHYQGNEFILVGNFLVLKDEEGTVTGQAAYCAACRDAAREMARNAEPPIKLTFYTAAGTKRVQEAATRLAETNAALMSQLKSAGARTFGGLGQGKMARADRDWRTSRPLRGHKK